MFCRPLRRMSPYSRNGGRVAESILFHWIAWCTHHGLQACRTSTAGLLYSLDPQVQAFWSVPCRFLRAEPIVFLVRLTICFYVTPAFFWSHCVGQAARAIPNSFIDWSTTIANAWYALSLAIITMRNTQLCLTATAIVTRRYYQCATWLHNASCQQE